MRHGLFLKLFLLQVLAATTLLGGALAVTRAYAVRSFGEFIEKRDAEQMHELAAELAKAYAQTPDLVKAAEAVPVLWRRLHRPQRALRCDGPGCPPPDDVMFGVPLGDADAPPPDIFFEGPPPEEQGAVTSQEPADGEPPRALRFRARGGAVRLGGPMPPLQLLDADGKHLLGVAEPIGDDGRREPVTYDGKIVAYLARPALRRPPEQLEFARKELRRFMVVGPVALVVAALFALAITALIVRPIRQLSGGAAALARREFGTRLPDDRRDELGGLAADFNRLAAALEGYDTRQRQWLADISHELRTPLAVLRGELEALMDGLRPADGGALRSLRQEIGRLEALTNDLQLVSQAESGALRLNRVPTDLGAVARQSGERFRERLKARGFELRVAADPGITADVDAQRIEQVLANLLENVLHHATPGPVTLVARADAGQAMLSVADTGPGVPAETLPRLFDRLYRVEAARTRAAGGGGLGLAICKSIVEAHGGNIHAQASSAGGLDVVITLPAGAPSGATGRG